MAQPPVQTSFLSPLRPGGFVFVFICVHLLSVSIA
jgi:hypothetical protein